MKSKAICIIGMHRSGTSAITHAVNLLGAHLGEKADMMPPSPDNPEMIIDTGNTPLEGCVKRVIEYLKDKKLINDYKERECQTIL